MNALALLGTGVVTPGGADRDALCRPDQWPRSRVPLVSRPDREITACRVPPDLPALEKWRKEPRARRAFPMALYFLEAAAQALEAAGSIPRARIGLVGAVHAGSIIPTRRFLQAVIENGPRAASPALFPETVHNSPLSHVASILGIDGACYTVCGDDTAWATALETASVWLELGRVDAVVVAAGEELDAISLEAYERAGWLRRSGYLPAEGAGAVLVGRRRPGVPLLGLPAEALPYRGLRKAAAAAAAVLGAVPESLPAVPTAAGTWLETTECAALAGRRRLELPPLPHAFGASAAWHTIRAIGQGGGPVAIPIFGLNHQVAALAAHPADPA